ncbi:MAG: Do family serine endopeptidase [Chthoniobacterales bacterium]|nr:Do family serine endopeptidase [Chthoniobacterales bacterium]
MKSFLQFLVFVLAITLALAGLYAWKTGQFAGQTPPQASAGPSALPSVKPAIARHSVPGLAALDEEFGRVAEAVIPSVVSITAPRGASADPREELLRQLFGMGRPPQPQSASQGSGVVASAEGHIVTNLHVIDGAEEVTVSLSDGRRFPARLLGADPLSDIAILKIEAEGLRPLPFADSEKVRVGQIVFAVGNPFGLQETITQGIISARERLFSSESVNEFFQTDAAINPGNSGGPLVNIRGEIVGINNFIFSQSGGSQGIGFSIPSNSARRVLDQIVQHGRVLRPYLGVVLQPMDQALADQLGLPDSRGALVEAVLAASPAAEGGILRGDVIRKFDGRDIRDFNDLRKRVAAADIGKTIKIEVAREGRMLELPVLIVEQQRPGRTAGQPAQRGGFAPQGAVPPASGLPAGNALVGVAVEEITPALIRRHGLPQNIGGVVVRSVAPGSPSEGMLQPGDAIEQVNDAPISSLQDFENAAGSLQPGEKAILLIARGRVRSFAVIGR